MKQYDYLTFIGRLEPPHIGHKQVFERALGLADKVIILVGSANQPRTSKNPFTFEERKQMLQEEYKEFADRIFIEPLSDNKYNDQAWAASVQSIVTRVVASFGWSDKPRRGGLIGCTKDESSYYLKMFPQWDFIENPMNEVVHATDIRKIYYESNILYLSSVVSPIVLDFLAKFSKTAEYAGLVEEYEFIKDYKKKAAAAPYPPTYVTLDAVIVQSAHILLVKRKDQPGKGLWALPGGFLKQKEFLVDGMIRELREETRLKVPTPVLKGCIKAKEVFDHPERSLRGRTITHAFYVELPPGELPKVKGRDDAEKAEWIPLSFVREQEMYEDHLSIIKHFVGEL